jgi:hypothetical protein
MPAAVGRPHADWRIGVKVRSHSGVGQNNREAGKRPPPLWSGARSLWKSTSTSAYFRPFFEGQSYSLAGYDYLPLFPSSNSWSRIYGTPSNLVPNRANKPITCAIPLAPSCPNVLSSCLGETTMGKGEMQEMLRSPGCVGQLSYKDSMLSLSYSFPPSPALYPWVESSLRPP